MKITIDYESSWRNSFLDGSNNEPLPKNGRKFIASITTLKKDDNFKEKSISLDTVMGVMNRLIGDQRKLYQSREDARYYFLNVEAKVKYEDNFNITSEMIYLRNIASGIKDDPTTPFTGAIKYNDPVFNSDYSQELWGVLALDTEELFEFIVNDSPVNKDITMDPFFISNILEEVSKLKKIENEGLVADCVHILHNKFPYLVKDEIENGYIDSDGFAEIKRFYFGAFYLQLERLENKYDLSSAKTNTGIMKGISKRNFTKKDFIEKYTTGKKKILFGNPYFLESYVKGEGKIKSLMTKASGTLEISIDVDRDKAKEIKQLIENAGVSSFYLGKKGLAYVTDIDTRELRI